MKTTLMILLLASVAAVAPHSLLADDLEPSRLEEQFHLVDQGPHEKTWARTNDLGEVTSRFVELATGLSVYDSNQSKWVDASAAIEIEAGVEGGAAATNAQHKVILAADANSAGATVLLQMPDGKQLQLQTIGLALTTLDNSHSMFIGEVKESIGQQVDDNTVIYPDAFAPVAGDLRVRNTLAGFESDVILREKINPADWNFNANNCKLEVWTQILEAPAARINYEQIAGRRAGDADQDQQIDYGTMAFLKGTAFKLDEPIGDAGERLAGIRVAKELLHLQQENLTFLIEAIPFIEAKPQIDALPVNEARKKPDLGTIKRMFAKASKTKRSKPVSVAAKVDKRNTRTAAIKRAKDRHFASTKARGFVIDYNISGAQTGYTFKGDTTYYVTADVTLAGTTIFEGGTVIKLTNGPSPSSLIANGPVNFQSTSYRPAVITCVDDHSVGEKLNNNGQAVATAYYGPYGLKLQNNVANSISNVVVRHAQTAIYMAAGSGGEVRHAQIVNCNKGVDALAAVALRNVLMDGIGNRAVSGTGAIALTGEHVTLAGTAAATGFYSSGGATLSLLNSIVIGFGTLGSYAKTATVDSFSTWPFVSSGAGNFYLSPGSSGLRNAGTTTGVNAALLAEIRQKTTEAPTVVKTDFTTPTTLAPTVRRDTDSLDLGYHYDPLDYLWSGRITTSTLVLTNGVAVGWNSAVGLTLGSGSAFYSEGRPERLNRFVRWPAVQEQTSGITTGDPMRLLDIVYTGTLPSARARFTDFSFLADAVTRRRLVDSSGGYILTSLVFVDCSLRGATWDLNPSKSISSTFTIALTNNYCERGDLRFSRNYSGDTTAVDVRLHNNLFRKGYIALSNYGAAGAWGVCNNLFDAMSLSCGYNSVVHGTNAYDGTTVLPGSTSGNKTSFYIDYQTGPLGGYYYPSAGSGLFSLVNQGNRNADTWGLYHHTTQVGQAKEAATQVDIGFHYVAVDASGKPLDYDGDGPPDYFEDTNGNGSSGDDLTGWSTYNSANWLQGATAIRIETPSFP